MKKIRWNSWGTQIAIWMSVFMIFIILLVYKSMQQDFSLVESDYYPKGLAFQEQIDKKQRGKTFQAQFELMEQAGTLWLQYPESLKKRDSIRGTIHFYHRESDAYDHNFDILIDSSGFQAFPIDVFNKGRYIVKINWMMDSTSYYSEITYQFK